ncbi:Transthyretin-like protein 4 [Meloidogyne graminicola]|uniref:Transthyretin-like protein 4 n=1 Tax=Meloidogyne graminicola TaxID=189291 RepID=A0A8T0A3C6_9BILA|nr:Transthyretin-like protein 4 [Meloidogyne graminicola]
MFNLLFLLFLIYNLLNISFAVRTQSVAVKGKLLCGQAPARNVRVKLFDEDSGPDPDDLLEADYSDVSGNFQLKGSTVETTNIDVVLKVYHDCDDGIKPGSRKIKFKIPNSYVTEGQNPKKVFDLGTLNLETIFSSEERELIVNKKRRYILYNWEDFEI